MVDDVGSFELWIKVDDAGDPSQMLPLVNPVPGCPGCKVGDQEGDENHTCPNRMPFVLKLFIRDPFKASVVDREVVALAIRVIRETTEESDNVISIRVDVCCG